MEFIWSSYGVPKELIGLKVGSTGVLRRNNYVVVQVLVGF